MDARATFWTVLHDLKFKELYLQEYNRYAEKLNGVLSAIVALASAASIAGWSVWSNLPWVWSSIIMLAQVVQILLPLLPYRRRIAAIRYMLPELKQLCVEVQTAWLRAQRDSDAKYAELFHDFESKYIAIDIKYLGSDAIPERKWLRDAVERDTATHLELFFGAKAAKGDDHNPHETHGADDGTKDTLL